MHDKRGSVWRKWDLHVHCPTTALNNQFEGDDENEKWENYIEKLEEFDDVSVLGITDYFSIDGYMKVKEFKESHGRLSKFDFIVPNCELRITPVTTQERAINFHFIFNPRIVDELDTLFFSKLEFEYESEPYLCRRDDLIRLGRAYKKNPGMDEEAAYREGVTQFKTTHNQISDVLKKSKKLRKNCLTGVSNSNQDGNSGIQHSSLAATREEIYRHSDFIFSSNPNDVKYFLGEGPDNEDEVKRQYGSLKPCIHGSDAHSLDDICNPDLDRYTWIKADPTFEGLRQIIFEPEHRVHIGKTEPLEPLFKINEIQIELPEDSLLDGQDYCLKGAYKLQFSPYFTCLIGGRGTGKSSILNLVDHYLTKKNKFFDDHTLEASSDKSLKIEDVVSFDQDSEESDVEFLSQNEIEKFAKDEKEFTQAIYKRLVKLDAENELEQQVNLLNNELRNIDIKISNFKKLKSLKQEVASLDKKIKKNENIINSLNDEEFTKKTNDLSNKNNRLNRFENSKNQLKNILSLLEEIKGEVPKEIDDEIPYEKAIEEISNRIDKILNDHKIENLNEQISSDKERLENDVKNLKEEINNYLKEKNLSEENLKEASNAQQILDSLRKDKQLKNEEIQRLNDKTKRNETEASIKEQFEQTINTHLNDLNRKFERMQEGEHVKQIKTGYTFNAISAKTNLCMKVKNWMAEENDTETNSVLRIDHLEIKLFLTQPQEVESIGKETFIKKLKEDDSKIANVLINHFSDDYNFKIYQQMIEREFKDVKEYKNIKVKYDGRPIKNTSFGQRCTAAIIILLSLGNNPIIIDEPEAHLDSALIADNLVNLIKESKTQRQIIFATHNANFVVNGDAELIYVLTIPSGSNKMELISTTIEDLENRPKLYALEGGKDAFKQREKRYSIS